MTTPNNAKMFIVRYATGPLCRNALELHEDDTELTVTIALSDPDEFSGGGTYFPMDGGSASGMLLRPRAGTCILHHGNIRHAGNRVVLGSRYVLVVFFDAADTSQFRTASEKDIQAAKGVVCAAERFQLPKHTEALASTSRLMNMPHLKDLPMRGHLVQRKQVLDMTVDPDGLHHWLRRELSRLLTPPPAVSSLVSKCSPRGVMSDFDCNVVDPEPELNKMAVYRISHDLNTFLIDHRLPHLTCTLKDDTIRGLLALAVDNRVKCLKHLQRKGVAELADRQALVNRIVKADRLGQLV